MSAAPRASNGISHPAARHGALRLAFDKRGERTVMTEQYSHAPLRVIRPIGHASGAALAYVLSPTGGVLHGDRYEVSIRVGVGAHAVYTTQAATKVYGMTGEGATHRTRIHVEEGGLLECVPDPLILYADSDFTQEVDVTLDEGARLVYQEIVVPGRVARGERLAFRQFTTRLTVRDGAGTLLHERATLRGGESLDRLGALDGFTCWGSWYCLGVGEIDSEAWAAVEGAGIGSRSSEAGDRPAPTGRGAARGNDTRHGSFIGGVTRTRRGGIAARMLAHGSQPIERAFADLAATVYRAALGIEPIELRKY